MEKNTLNRPQPPFKRSCRLLVALLLLLLVLGYSHPRKVTAASSQAYTHLRLLVEALYEIDSKYVTEKKDKDLMYGAIRGLVASLDPNSSFLSPAEYQESQVGTQFEADAGLELTVKDNILTVIAPVEGGPAWKAGIRADDHILKINNQTTRNITALEAARKFQGSPGTKIKLQIVRTGFVKPQDVDLVLEKNTVEGVSYYSLEDGFSYIRLRTPRERSVQELQQVLRAIQSNPARKGIILDLRNTAGGQLEEARKLASVFVGSDAIYSVRGRNSERKQSVTGIREYQVLKEKLPLVILVDQGTAKAAEILAGALQSEYRALLLGYKTFGDCAVTQLFPLKDGSALIVSTGYCYTPRGQLIQGKGLEPDISGPKKDTEEKPVTNSDVKLEKPKKIPDVNEVMQDPLVQQALTRLKGWGKTSFSKIPEHRLRKKQASRTSSPDGEIS